MWHLFEQNRSSGAIGYLTPGLRRLQRVRPPLCQDKQSALMLLAADATLPPSSLLLRHQMFGWGHCALWSRRRDRERQPGIPARWSICRIEFAVAF